VPWALHGPDINRKKQNETSAKVKKRYSSIWKALTTSEIQYLGGNEASTKNGHLHTDAAQV
jgi:hypothetical protein